MHQATKTLPTAPIMQLGSYFISPSLPDKNDKPCLHVHTATNNKPQSYHRASCCPGLDELLAGSHTDMFIAANIFFCHFNHLQVSVNV